MRYFIVFILFFNTFLWANTSKSVLILNSYHKGFELSDTIIRNIEKTFYSYEDIDIDILYMDSKKIYSRDYKKELSKLYSLQLENRTFDLIITIDRFAYKLAVKNFNDLFPNKPMLLFIGVEQYSQELARVYNLDNRINGIIQKLPIKDNIDLIFKFIPDLKKLYILNDRSPNGNDSSPFIRDAINKVKHKVKVEYLRDDSLESFKEYFSEYKEDEAILFIRFSNDYDGGFYKTNEVSRAIDEFKLPVFVTDTLFMEKGALGGKLISIENLGVVTSKKAIDILYKKDYRLEVSTNEDFEYIFDANKLKEFGLFLPKGLKNYTLINAPVSFFEKNRNLINIVFLATPILLVVIFGLLQALYEKQQSSRKLKQRVKFDKALLNAIESPIFWQDKDDIVLDANAKFCELIEVSYDELLGSKLLEFYHSTYQTNCIIDYLHDFENGKLENSQIVMKNSNYEKKIYFLNQTSSEQGIVTIFTDITKEKEIELEKIKHTQYMIQQSKLAEIGEIFSSIAHQWKAPLVEITSLAQDMFFSGNTSEKEEDSYHINNIMIQAKYMTSTINDFQDFIMPSQKKTIFNVPITIESMLNIVKHNMKYNYIHIEIDIKNSKNLNVYGYENEFMQAILNIINNAKDALLSNNEKNRKIIIKLRDKLNVLVIDIIDNGYGISKEASGKIFLQYFSTKKQGHGIGLYMTKLIIQDKLGGKIKYKRIRNGSCFRIQLRLHHENISA